MLGLGLVSSGASGWVGETDKGGAVDNKGGIITATGNSWPAVTPSAAYTIPLRTPFTLTGSATDADSDPLTYIWEQNDRGGSSWHVAAQQHQDGRPAVRDVLRLGPDQ